MRISLKAYLGTNSKYKEIEMRNIISTVWSKAATVRGKDPDLYRRDPYNNVMYKYSYGKASNTNLLHAMLQVKPLQKFT